MQQQLLNRQSILGRREFAPAAIPRGDTYLSLRLRRPQGQEPLWGFTPGGVPRNFEEGTANADVIVPGLDTEILRAYVFLTEDGGLSWYYYGAVGTPGDDPDRLFTRRGSRRLETTFRIPLPDERNDGRQVQVVAHAHERLSTQIVLETDRAARAPVFRRSLHNSLAFDATADAGAANASTVSTANITPANNRRAVFVAGGNEASTPAGFTSSSFGASGTTSIFNDVSTYYRVHLGVVTGVSTTAAACTYTIANADDGICVGGMAMSDVDQTTPNDAAVGSVNGGTNPSITIGGAGAGDIELGVFCGDGNYTISSGTGRVEIENIGSYSTSLIAGSGNSTISYTGGTFGYVGNGCVINEDLGVAPGANPKGVFGLPLHGPFGGPVG